MAVDSVGNQKTIQEIIDSTAKSTERTASSELGKDDFLNLLVTQLKYQDPLQPMDDKEFIGQMAQFSSLEQMQNLNSSFSSVKAFNLIGKTVVANVSDDSTGETKTVTGEVTSVKMSAGKTYVIVDDQEIEVDKIVNVYDNADALDSTKGTDDISKYTNFIGFNVDSFLKGDNDEKVNVEGVVRTVKNIDNETAAILDGVVVDVSDVGADASYLVDKADSDYVKKYLDENMGDIVSVKVHDDESDSDIAVSAVLRDYNIDSEGKIVAMLDGVIVPADSISGATKVDIVNGEQVLLNQILQALTANEDNENSVEETTTEGSEEAIVE